LNDDLSGLFAIPDIQKFRQSVLEILERPLIADPLDVARTNVVLFKKLAETNSFFRKGLEQKAQKEQERCEALQANHADRVLVSQRSDFARDMQLLSGVLISRPYDRKARRELIERIRKFKSDQFVQILDDPDVDMSE